jgi:hypothetical protein
MKKMLIALVLVLLLAMMVSTVAFAAAGWRAPAIHGVDGRTFGGLVSALAQFDPLALAAHVSGR